MTVCVLCGRPWEPSIKNRCECGGFCTWGDSKDAPPSSWSYIGGGRWIANPVHSKTSFIRRWLCAHQFAYQIPFKQKPDPKAIYRAFCLNCGKEIAVFGCDIPE